MPGSLANLKSTASPMSTLALAAALATLAASQAFAQQAFAQAPPPATAAAPAAKPAKAAPAPSAPKAAKPESAPSGDAALRQRIEHLEEQLVDMQVVVGTLDSFAKSNGAASASQTYRAGAPEPSAGASGVDQARVAGLESQVRALTAQVQQLTEQVRAQSGQQRRGDASPSAYSPAAAAPSTSQPAPQPVATSSGFGSTSVQTAAPDSIDSVIAATSTAPLPPAASPSEGGNPKQLYETAYGYLLQQDYGAAETAFDDFLKRFPNDNLAGNAQFWLGESYFVRGQFKPAASAFLKGYQTYGKSAKAPDSLLKLAMSLGRMGQKDAACASFGELNTRFPASSADVKSRAAAEKQRTGCP